MCVFLVFQQSTLRPLPSGAAVADTLARRPAGQPLGDGLAGGPRLPVRRGRAGAGRPVGRRAAARAAAGAARQRRCGSLCRLWVNKKYHGPGPQQHARSFSISYFPLMRVVGFHMGRLWEQSWGHQVGSCCAFGGASDSHWMWNHVQSTSTQL